MTPELAGQLIAALLVATAAFSALAWNELGRPAFLGLAVSTLVGAAGVAWMASAIASPWQQWDVVVVLAAGAAATLGGGPATSQLVQLIDGGRDAVDHPLESAGQILRGGAWIGAFERVAVFGAMVLDAPEAIAVVLALKGVGRYQELRESASHAAAERFIIGTFASVLWAIACSLVALEALRGR